ncbi:MAG: mannose-1-phosphate guanylyltransferase [Deltaproteobacteria bacterium]
MKVVILAGGGGTRLFPLSRPNYPKQFLKIGSDKSLIGQTIERYLKITQPKNIIIVTNEAYVENIKAELKESNAEEANILVEPVSQNTAPAIALTVRYCLDELGIDSSEVLFISPADHIIRPESCFLEKVEQAVEAARRNRIITFGVKPYKPETGYGYIKTGKCCESGFVVESFVEKPDKEKAKEYLREGNYYWNSGMYAFSIDTFVEELGDYQPEVYRLFNSSYQELLQNFKYMPSISIDYAIAEKSTRVVTIPIDVYWSDIGSWDAIYDLMDKDENGNAKIGDCITNNCSNSLMIGNNRIIAGVGLENIVVIETDDVILIAKKGETQRVKDLVKDIESYNSNNNKI